MGLGLRPCGRNKFFEPTNMRDWIRNMALQDVPFPHKGEWDRCWGGLSPCVCIWIFDL